MLLVQEQDISRVTKLLNRQWAEELKRNGLSFVPPENQGDGGGVTCPACGTTAPLEDGACSDCGLMLG
jgi:hypothetical protein